MSIPQPRQQEGTPEMPEITILNESELRRAIELDKSAVDCIENAFRLLATEAVEMPPILSMHIRVSTA